MKKFYLTASLLAFTVLSFAQKTPQDSLKNSPPSLTASDVQKLLPQITPKSPNVAGLERHGDYPVNMYAGLPSIEIPLYEVKVGNLVVPVKLSYHASGNKVTDNASWVGMGWSLVGDYVLSRNVRGLADEKDFSNNNSLLQNNLPVLPPIISCLTDALKTDFTLYVNGGKDAERDIFTYHTPNKTNSFVILPNQTGVIWQEADKSILSYSGGLQNMSLLDENGIKYLYETPDVTVSPSSGTGDVSAWHLKEIQGIKATDKVKFSYQANNAFNITGDIADSEIYHTDIAGASASTIPGGFQGNFNTPNTPGILSQLLKEIIFPMGKVVFVPSTADRQDNLGKSLEAIEIYGFNPSTNQYTLLKKYAFIYVYKQRIATYTGNVALFLDKIELLTNTNTVLGSYRFNYNSQALPATTSTAKDYWGYYNAQTQNTTLIPPLTYTGIVYAAVPVQQTFQIGGANREVNAIASDAWMLNRVFYPTGGYTTFEYECNRYLDANNVQQLAGGQRIKRIISDDNTGVTTTKTYKYGIGELGNGTLRSQAFKFFSTIQKIKRPAFTAGDPDYNYLVRTFSSANTLAINPNEGSPVTYPFVTEYEDIGTGTNGRAIYTFKDDVSDDMITLLSNGKSAQRNRYWNRGQLLSKVTYGADGKKKTEQTNTYSTITSGSSSTIGYLIGQSETRLSGLPPGPSGCYVNDDDFNAIPITWDYGLVKQTASIEKNYDNGDDSKFTTKKMETTYSSTHYQPVEMKEYVSNNVVLGKLLWYPQDFMSIPLFTTVTGEVDALRSLQQRNVLSTVIEEIDYRKDLLAPAPPAAPPLQITGGKFITFELISTSGIEKAIVPKTVSLTECIWNTFLNPNNTINFTPATGLFNPATNTNTIPRNINHKTRIYFDTYDTNGNLTTFHQSDGATTKYNYTTASNDGLSFVYPTSEIQNYVSPNPLGIKALTTNFSFTIPLLGMDSMTDQSGLTTYFEYDTFSRLFQIKDHNDKIVKKYQYQY